MTWRAATILILIVMTALLVVWDILAASNKTPGDTITEVIRDVSHRWPILPFAAGLLCGHLFFSK